MEELARLRNLGGDARAVKDELPQSSGACSRDVATHCVRATLLAIIACASVCHAAESSPTGAPTDYVATLVEEVLVTGEHPGPGLWKISKGPNTLRVLGTHAPLPSGLIWQSKEVESAIANSDAVLGAYSVLLRVDQDDALRSQRNSLKRVLPRRAYARWRGLAKRFIGEGSKTDQLLPSAAALLLQSKAYEQNGLRYTDDIWRRIHNTAAFHRVPIWPQSYELDAPANASNRAGRARSDGAAYLVETMDRLDSDIRESRARANAWATGDVETLRALAAKDASYANSLAYSWPFLTREDARSLQVQAENKLLVAIERALNQHDNTFAALPIYLLLGQDGLIAKLRNLGYRIEEPA